MLQRLTVQTSDLDRNGVYRTHGKGMTWLLLPRQDIFPANNQPTLTACVISFQQPAPFKIPLEQIPNLFGVFADAKCALRAATCDFPFGKARMC